MARPRKQPQAQAGIGTLLPRDEEVQRAAAEAKPYAGFNSIGRFATKNDLLAFISGQAKRMKHKTRSTLLSVVRTHVAMDRAEALEALRQRVQGLAEKDLLAAPIDVDAELLAWTPESEYAADEPQDDATGEDPFSEAEAQPAAEDE